MVLSTADPGAEILEENAEGKIKTLYADIRGTFRVPVVDGLFRALAAQHEDYLVVAWRALQPNLRTIFFEKRSDDLRRLAVERIAAVQPHSALTTNDEIANVLRVFHYVNPKLLLATAALRSATTGQEPKLQELAGEEKRQLPIGMADGARPMDVVDPTLQDERTGGVLRDMQATLGISIRNGEYRALARWPDYLESAWATLKPLSESPDYKRTIRDLGRATQQAIASLPFRIDLNPHTLRHCGLSERDIDGVRALLDDSYDFLLRRVANVAFLTCASLGPEVAVKSPYPVSSP